jgi:hypothetical protein
MSRVKSNPVPTDYFPRQVFEKIVVSTYAYQEKGYAEIRNHATRLRTMVLLIHDAPFWSHVKADNLGTSRWNAIALPACA